MSKKKKYTFPEGSVIIENNLPIDSQDTNNYDGNNVDIRINKLAKCFGNFTAIYKI